MTKRDLETGMIAETREGNRYVFLTDNVWDRDVFVAIDGNTPAFIYLDTFNYNLRQLEAGDSNLDIMKVFCANYPGLFCGETIWERQEQNDLLPKVAPIAFNCESGEFYCPVCLRSVYNKAHRCVHCGTALIAYK